MLYIPKCCFESQNAHLYSDKSGNFDFILSCFSAFMAWFDILSNPLEILELCTYFKKIRIHEL